MPVRLKPVGKNANMVECGDERGRNAIENCDRDAPLARDTRQCGGSTSVPMAENKTKIPGVML